MKEGYDSLAFVKMHSDLIGERNNIIIPRKYLDLVEGDYIAAVVLRDIVAFTAWSYQNKDRDGWFYRKEQVWEEQSYLSGKQVNRGIAKINTIAGEKVIEKKLRKLVNDDGTMMQEVVNHYRLDNDAFVRFYKSGDKPDEIEGGFRICQNGEFRDRPNGIPGNRPNGSSLTYIQEGNIKRENSNHRASDEAPVGANAPTPANAGVLPPQEDSSLTGMKNLGKRVSGKQSTQKEPGSAAAAPTDRRVWAMVTAYHEALKVDDHSVPTRTRHQVYKIFAGLPSWVGETAVRGCVQYIQSDPFWREPGRTTADKVAKTILEWDAAGRPTSVVGKGRGNTQAVVEVTRSYIEQWDGPAGGDDTNMIEG